MRKRIQKIIGLMLVIFASCFCGLVGCKDKYANMTIQASTKSIELFLDETDNDGKMIGNSAEVSVTVGGVDGSVSKEVLQPSVSSPDIVAIKKVNMTSEGTTKFLITANEISSSPVVITFLTKEGGKSTSIEVTVTRKVTEIATNQSYKPFAVVGEGSYINTSKAIVFAPQNTSQKDVVYSIKNANGHTAEITENGYLTVTEKNGSEPLIITATSKANPTLSCDIEVKVIKPITDQDFKLYINEVADGNEITDSYNWSVLDLESSEMKLILKLTSTENVIISSDSGVIASSQKTISAVFPTGTLVGENEILLSTTGSTGSSKLKLVLQIAGYDYKVEKQIAFTVSKLPNSITVNGEDLTNKSKTYDIYDKYQNKLGQKFEVKIGDDTASDRRYKISLAKSYGDISDAEKQRLLGLVKFSFASGDEIELDSPISASTNSFYIMALHTNERVNFDIIAVGSSEENPICATIKLNLSKGISTNGIKLEDDIDGEMLVELTGQVSSLSEIDFSISKEEYTSQFKVYTSNESIVRIINSTIKYIDGISSGDKTVYSFEFLPLKEGTTEIIIQADNNEKLTILVRVIKRVDDILLTTDSPIKNSFIADNGEDMYKLSTISGQKTLNTLVISNSTTNLKINLIKLYKNEYDHFVNTSATIISQRLEIVDGDDGKVASVAMHDKNAYGFVTALKSGKCKIKCTVVVYDVEKGQKEYSQEFDLIVYVPIEKVALSRNYIEIFDTTDKLFYQDNLKAEISANIYPLNATLNYEDKDFSIISWSVSTNDYFNIDTDDNKKIKIEAKHIQGDDNSTTTFVTATVIQFSKIFNVTAEVNVKKLVTVSQVGTTYIQKSSGNKTYPKEVLNSQIVDKKVVDLYLDSRDGLKNTYYTLSNDILPTTANYKDLMYIALPSLSDYTSGVYKVSPNLIFNNSTFTVNRAGRSKILILSKDSINKSSFNNEDLFAQVIANVYSQATTEENLLEKLNNYLNDNEVIYKLLEVKIADGSSEALSLHINTISDLLSVNTLEGLNKCYVLTNTIDCSSIYNFTPIGSLSSLGFSGIFNGGSQDGYAIKNLRFNSKDLDEQNYTFGLFSKINAGARVKNLNITVQEINISIVNGNTSTMEFGGIAVVNDGEITNVSSHIANSNILTNNRFLYIGAVVARNNGIIHSPKVTGTFTLRRTGGEKTVVGGVAGENTGTIKSVFEMFGSNSSLEKIIESSEYDSAIQILANFIYIQTSTLSSGIGGIVGDNTNSGKVQNVTSNAFVGYSQDVTQPHYMPSNVGGIAGKNSGNIEECYANVILNGNTNIGGIVGLSVGGNIKSVYTLMFEQYDQLTTNKASEYIKISGYNYIGGIVGYAQDTAISYAMVRSYVNRDFSKNNYEGDIVLKKYGTNSQYVGSIAGYMANGELSSSFAYVTVNGTENAVFGGLVGKSNQISIQNCYSRGKVFIMSFSDAFVGEVNNVNASYLYSDTYSQQEDGSITKLATQLALSNIIVDAQGDEFASWVTNNNWFEQTPNYNDNLPVLNKDGNYFILQEPQDLTLSVSENNQFEVLNNTLTGLHKKLSDKKTMIFYYGKDSNKNAFSLNSILGVSVTPQTASNLCQYKVIEGSDVIKIVNGKIYVLKTGKAKISCVSLLNNQASDICEVFVENAVTTIGIYETIDSTQNIDTVKVVKNHSKQIYFDSDCQAELDYQIKAQGNLNLINLNGETLNAITNLTSYNSLLLSAMESGYDLTLQFVPFFNIDGEKIEIGLSVTISVQVVNGITDIEMSLSGAEISQNDNVTFNINAIADAESNISATIDENNLTIKNNAELSASVTQNGSEYTFKVYNSANQVDTASLSLEKIDFASDNRSMVTIKIETSPKTYSIIVPIIVKAEIGEQSLSKTFILTINPQPVHFIDLQFYSYAEQNADDSYNVNEVPTDKILAGRMGLLKIDLFPYFAQINRVELLYSNFDYTVDLQQMIFDAENENYVMLNMATPKINNGIVFDNSYKNILSKQQNDGTQSFDGYLYVYALIPSISRINSTLSFTVKAYSSNGDVVSKTINLTVALPNTIEVTLGGNTSDYISKGIEYNTLTVTTTNLLNSVADDSNIVLSARIGDSGEFSNSLADLTITKIADSTTLIGEGIYQTKYKIIYNGDISSQIQIQASYRKLVNNQYQTYVSKTNLTLTCVAFKVTGFSVDGVKNGVMEKSTGAEYTLRVLLNIEGNLDATFDYHSSSIKVSDYKEILEKDISNKLNTWYALYSRLEDKITIQSYEPIVLNDSLTETPKYDYFMFIKFVIDSTTNEYVLKIAPTRESITEVMQTAFGVKYDGGIPVCLTGNGALETENLLSHSNGEYDYTNKIVYFKDRFQLKFIYNNTSDKPNPIATAEQFLMMQNDKNYRLVNDIVFNEPFKPMDIDLAGLDGNGFKIYLNAGFDVSELVSESALNVGLFQTVYDGMILKNLNVYLSLNKDNYIVDLTNIYAETEGGENTLIDASTINFGVVAGQNNGIIYNCQVHNCENAQSTNKLVKVKVNLLTSAENQIEAFIGGIAGQNNGSLTHSQSYIKLSANKGYLGGLVGQNNGAIASCFYKADSDGNVLENESTTEVGTKTGALVAINNTDATIKYSYAEGKTLETNGYRYNTGKVYTSANSSGFVCYNKGLIQDCYSNIPVESLKRSSGFVFENEGTIKNSYSASLVKVNSTVSTAFMGTTDNLNINSSNKNIINCYYFEDEKIIYTANGELAQGFESNGIQSLNLDLCDENQENGVWAMYKYSFVATEKDNATYGIVKMGFGYKSISVTKQNQNLPTLLDANIIAIPHVAINNIVNENDPTKDKEYEWQDGYYGSMFNPHIVSNATEFNEQFAPLDDNENLDNSHSKEYYRIISDIKFDEITKPSTTSLDFNGYIAGNGFTISGLKIGANSSIYATSVKSDNSSYGLFATISGNANGNTTKTNFDAEDKATISSQDGTVKDLKIEVNYLSANQVLSVGVLAGEMNNVCVSNVEIDGAGIIIQGKSFVGGLAGKIDGTSTIIKNITTNVGINAGAYQTAEQFEIYNENRSKISYGYAGAFAGAVLAGKVQNITIESGVYIIANFGGFGIGLVGKGATISNLTINVDEGQYIKSQSTAGGAVAENRGKIIKSKVVYTGLANTQIFRGTPKVIGGLVGFNYGGKIIGSYSKIDVINAGSLIAGGLVGTTAGGSVTYSYATGNVQADSVAGGLVGSSLSEKALVKTNTDVTDETASEQIKNTLYTIQSLVINNENVKFTLSNTLSLGVFNQSKARVFSLVIGTISKNNNNEIAVLIENGYNTYLKNNDGLSACDSVSNIPNGTKENDAIPEELFTDKIVYNANNDSIDFTLALLQNASTYYKKIFETDKWKVYYDISSITRTNPYPDFTK